jgi:hypothetical protein
MKKWKLRQSIAKGAKNTCVIKLKENNLTGDFMKLSKHGNNEFSFLPESTGVYRVMNNIDRTKGAMKGCYLVYQLSEETFTRYLTISDENVTKLSDEEIQNPEFINDLAKRKRLEFKL